MEMSRKIGEVPKSIFKHILTDGALKAHNCELLKPSPSAGNFLHSVRATPNARPAFPLLAAWFKAEAARYGPAPKEMPPVLVTDFTLNGSLAVERFYWDQSYLGGPAATPLWTVEAIQGWQRRIQAREKTITYDMAPVYAAMADWSHLVRGKRGLVVGTERPWAEAMLIEFGARTLSTLEFGRIVSEHPLIETWTPDAFKMAFWAGHIPQYDFAFSYSSIEHDGLGRYGDILNPIGDLQAMAKLLTMVKPGGFLFLGVPCCRDAISWNAHRYYGTLRIPAFLAGWTLIAHYEPPPSLHPQPMWLLQNTFSCA